MTAHQRGTEAAASRRTPSSRSPIFVTMSSTSGLKRTSSSAGMFLQASRSNARKIDLRDRVVLILSEHSINSDWVEDEVTAGFEEERKRGQEVLFPIRLDETVMTTKEAWAAKLRARLIGDFRGWKDHDKYAKQFERVLRDLKAAQIP
jgi:hypothetical protein